MDILEHYKRLFAYDDWANREMLNSLKAPGSPARSLKLLSHILAAEIVWRSRINYENSPIAVWPDLSLEECLARIDELKESWQNHLSGLTVEDLSRPIEYKNTKGEPFTSPLYDILTHILMHSAYHRGQIAADVRASDHVPAYTDFIHCARQGFID